MIYSQDNTIFEIYSKETGGDTPNSAFLEGYINGLVEAGFSIGHEIYNDMMRPVYPDAPVMAIGFIYKNIKYPNPNNPDEPRFGLLYRIAIFPETTIPNAFKLEAFQTNVSNDDHMRENHIDPEEVKKVVKEFNEQYKDKVFQYKNNIETLEGLQWVIRTQLNKNINKRLRIEQPSWDTDIKLHKTDIEKGYKSFYDEEFKY